MARALFLTAAPRRGRRGSDRRRSGIACVELAVVITFLSTLVLGMFEIGRALQVRQILTDAARKGCRTGIIYQYGNTDIVNDVTNVLRDNGFDSTTFNPSVNGNSGSGASTSTVGSITITVTDPNGNTLSDALDAPSGTTVSVQVSIPCSSILWIAPTWLTDTTMVSDLIVMMKQ
jgi:Flp pilus assembly protein TadG